MKKFFGAVFGTIALLLCSCEKAPSDAETSRADVSRVYSYDYALSEEEIAERYAGLSAKLYPYGEENAEQTISAEGLAYFTEIRGRFLEEYGDGDEEVIRMYDFMLDDRQFFPAADGGLFAVYGYRMLGELCASYYDIFFLSASEETLLYTEPQSQFDTDFLGNGEKLMIFFYNRQLMPCCILDRGGESTWLTFRECEIAVPAEGE